MNVNMNTSYKASYPCKVISSFFDNYFKRHEYDKIKKITFRKLIPKSDDEILIHKFFELFNLLFTIPIESSSDLIKRHYEYIFNKKIDETLYQFVISKSDKSNIFEWLEECFEKIIDTNICDETYLLFIISTLKINEEFNHSCVIPITLFENLFKINGKKVREYFIKGFFENLFKTNDCNLKDTFLQYILKNKNRHIKNGISHIYIFGSILTGDYHDSSDFDLVIEYENKVNIEKIKKITNKLKSDIFKRFKRNSDIHTLNNFTKVSDIDKAYKIF